MNDKVSKRINWRLTIIKYIKQVIKALRFRNFYPIYTYSGLNLPVTVSVDTETYQESQQKIAKVAQAKADLARSFARERNDMLMDSIRSQQLAQSDLYRQQSISVENTDG